MHQNGINAEKLANQLKMQVVKFMMNIIMEHIFHVLIPLSSRLVSQERAQIIRNLIKRL